MKKNFVLLIMSVLCAVSVCAQNFDVLFSSYTPLYTPPSPVYITPMPDIVDNSVTIINNSYAPSTPSVRCTDSQKQSGQVLMIDNTTNKNQVIDAEVLFKSYSNNTASITITRLKLDGKWYPMDIDVIRLSSLLDSTSGNERNNLLELMKNFTFFANAEDVLFLF